MYLTFFIKGSNQKQSSLFQNMSAELQLWALRLANNFDVRLRPLNQGTAGANFHFKS